jgi:hyperosmotically inducible periplasmic protein
MDSQTKMVGVVSCVVLMGLVGLSGCESTTGISTRQTASDVMITAAVQTKLTHDDRLATIPPIHVDTKRGVVSLHGAMPTESDRDRATRLAREVEGVTTVNNDLEILPWR